MADNNEEIEEPAEVIEQVHKEAVDHIPLKDQFSSDLSDIDLNDYPDKQDDPQGSQKVIALKPKRKKIIKTYEWRHRWVKQMNIVTGSGPLWLKRWVKVRYHPSEQELREIREELVEKDKGALELAHAIIQEQMNNEM